MPIGEMGSPPSLDRSTGCDEVADRALCDDAVTFLLHLGTPVGNPSRLGFQPLAG
jgi:hypothetical protein